MTVSFNNRNNVEVIIQEINKFIADDAAKPFYPLFVRQISPVLLGSLRFPDDLSDFERLHIITLAVNEFENADISEENLLTKLNSHESKYLSKPCTPYFLLTTMSLTNWANLPEIRRPDCIIRFGTKNAKKFLSQHDEVIHSQFNTYEPESLNGYIPVLVRVKARMEIVAVNKALENLAFIRGIFNLFLNSKSTWRKSTKENTPVNYIIPGQYHTLHYPDGSSVGDIFWYEPFYTRIRPKTLTPREATEIPKNVNKVRANLSKCPYKPLLENFIKKYCEALDTPDLAASMLKQWSLLEKMLQKDKNEIRKAVLQRASYLDGKNKYSYLLLETIYEQRNKYVHMSTDIPETEVYAYLIKWFVEKCLRYFLYTGYNFPNHLQGINFLEVLSNDIDVLRNDIKVNRKAIRYKEKLIQ